MDRLDSDAINSFVLAKQHLTNASRCNDVCRVTSDISGLHATGAREPYLALFARTVRFDRSQLDEQLCVKRSLVKMRCVRGTLYILPAGMAPVAFCATRGMFERPSERYAESLGIAAGEYAEFSARVLRILHGREMTIAEIRAALKSPIHFSALLNLMCDRGLLARVQQGNGWESRSLRYAVFNEYFPDIDLCSLEADSAIACLMESYLRSFGPATETDVAWWTGLGKTPVRKALKGIEGRTSRLADPWNGGELIALASDLKKMAPKSGRGKQVSLLPCLDPYIMGYKQRERYLDEEHSGYVFDRSGNATATVLVDGRVAGVWDYSEKGLVGVFLFSKPRGEERDMIESEALRTGEFLCGSKPEVAFVSSMTPLARRTAGGFLSPLRQRTNDPGMEGVNDR